MSVTSYEKCLAEINKYELMGNLERYNERKHEIFEAVTRQFDSIIEELKDDNKHIILLSGLPGSGKSTFTNNEYIRSNYLLLSLDDPLYKGSVASIKQGLTDAMKTDTKNIIIDGTFLTKSSIQYFRKKAAENAYMFQCIHMNIPLIYSYFNIVNRCLDPNSEQKLMAFYAVKAMQDKADIYSSHPSAKNNHCDVIVLYPDLDLGLFPPRLYQFVKNTIFPM